MQCAAAKNQFWNPIKYVYSVNFENRSKSIPRRNRTRFAAPTVYLCILIRYAMTSLKRIKRSVRPAHQAVQAAECERIDNAVNNERLRRHRRRGKHNNHSQDATDATDCSCFGGCVLAMFVCLFG